MVPRRHVLAGCSVAIAATAGCLGDETIDPPSGGENAATADDENPTPDDGGMDTDQATADDRGDDATEHPDESEPSPETLDEPLVTALRRDENVESDDPESGDTERDDRSADDVESEGDGPTDDEVVLVTHGEVADVGTVGRDEQRGNYYLPLQFTDDGVSRFTGGLVAVDAFQEPEEQELVVYVDGEVLGTYGLGQTLSDAIRTGRWDGNFRVVALEEAPLVELRETLAPST
ncbi:hypothetical protein [Natrialba sp. INN-245]|uniref:hypothetical protein n=1 Tax=Natrialba sp. INN-245 TaxID=2690967 RepID=UPI001313B847|nr:hypothetical protein [Natrialba sp. INN-245]MWV40745.1 hypothetical protein [Natrialba sp. INN-245]